MDRLPVNLFPDLDKGISQLPDSLCRYVVAVDTRMTSPWCLIGFWSGEQAGNSVALMTSSYAALSYARRNPGPTNPISECRQSSGYLWWLPRGGEPWMVCLPSPLLTQHQTDGATGCWWQQNVFRLNWCCHKQTGQHRPQLWPP